MPMLIKYIGSIAVLHLQYFFNFLNNVLTLKQKYKSQHSNWNISKKTVMLSL